MPLSALAGGWSPQTASTSSPRETTRLARRREHAEHRELPGLARAMLVAVAPDRDRPEHSHPQRHHRQPPPFAAATVRPAYGHAD